MTDDIIRPLQQDDLPPAQALIAAVDLFPPEMLHEMVLPFLEGSDVLWLIAGDYAAIAHAAPERLTDGTWNLLLLAVDPARQRQGQGRRLVAEVEAALRAKGARLLLVETSGVPAFAGQRRFYTRLGFRREARIRDFYLAGEDKVSFAKSLSG